MDMRPMCPSGVTGGDTVGSDKVWVAREGLDTRNHC
jgi:hypothetical protein